MRKVLPILLLILSPILLHAQSEDETKSFIENIYFHNPSKYQNLQFKFFFKSETFGFVSNIQNCPPRFLNVNDSDFMIVERYDAESKNYSSTYLKVSSLRGYKLTSSFDVYYLELQSKGNNGAFFEHSCTEYKTSSITLSTSSKKDVDKLIKALSRLSEIYKNSFVDLENLFNEK